MSRRLRRGSASPCGRSPTWNPCGASQKIVHRNGVRCITVSADLKRDVNAMRMTSRISKMLKDEITLPAGVNRLAAPASSTPRLFRPSRRD